MNGRTAEIPKDRQTTLGLYVTAREAYERWRADPAGVTILDVRTPEELLFVGHPVMAWKIPVALQRYEWDPVKKEFPMQLLSDFVTRVCKATEPGDTVDDAQSVFVGQRLRNGWKDSGCPWTYKLTADRMLLPETQ